MHDLLKAFACYLVLISAQLALFTSIPELSKKTMMGLGYLFVGCVPIYGSVLFMLLERQLTPKDIGAEAAEVFEAEWSVYFSEARPSVKDRTAA